MTSLLGDAFAHHVWATVVLIDACAELTSEELSTSAAGTYGRINDTLRHLVHTDCWYLSFFPGEPAAPTDDEANHMGLGELRSLITRNGTAWARLLATEIDPDEDIVEVEESGELHSPVGVRLAQVIHHGTDHRSHVCTALTILGVTPPEIDVWAFARASGREWVRPTPASD